MTSKQAYELSFDLNVLHHLGVGLYSNIPAVLSEMVANSWDSGATLVAITLANDMIVVEDNGIGMSQDEVNERFLRVGYQKRKQDPILFVAGKPRHVMGRKGIGKLSAFSIADEMELHTAKNGHRSGFIMGRLQLEAEIERGARTFYPTPVEDEKITIIQGTKVRLTSLKQSELGVEQNLRTALARRFSVINRDGDFQVVINDAPITLKDRDYYEKVQFIWYFGEESRHYTARCLNLKYSKELRNVVDNALGYRVAGWIATVAKPKDIDDPHHTIAIFANGKLIQEDILSEIQDARLFRQYIIGEIDADFMDADDEDDIVLSDRQRINQIDPRYALLRSFIANELKKIANSWDDLRKQFGTSNKPKAKGGRSLVEDSQPPLISLDPNNTSSSPVAEEVTDELLSNFANAETQDTSGTFGMDSVESAIETASGTGRPVSAPSKEAQALFSSIRSIVETSTLETNFKSVILYDLEQARLAYYCQAYKACIVMLGAVLEGLMLGRLRQPDMLKRLLNDSSVPPNIGQLLGGLQNPSYSDSTVLADNLAKKLSFESYRVLICRYIPGLENLGVENIQKFRNSVHPWRSIEQPNIYKVTTNARALVYLGSLAELISMVLGPDGVA